MEFSDHRPTYAIVDLEAIRHNVSQMIAALQPGQQLYASVKANAYGHGSVPIAQAVLQAGVDGLLVATVDEAIELREAGIIDIPILVLGLTDPRGIAEILFYDLTITISTMDWFERAEAQLRQTNRLGLLNEQSLQYHLAIDTGMGRIGLRTQEEVRDFFEQAQSYSWANCEGAYTHMATASGGAESYVYHQFERWQELTQALPNSVKVRHYANSASAMWFQDLPTSDIVRYGIGIFGIDPKDEPFSESSWNVIPALELVSELSYTKKVEAGSCISYGAAYIADEDQWIGTIPIGYGDGWLRSYQKVTLQIQGHDCPVVGVINMDQLMVRLPEYYPPGTPVTLISRHNEAVNSVSNIAKKVGTIGYEIITNIGSRVPRIYINE